MAFVVVHTEKVLKDGKLLLKFYRARTYESSTIVKNARVI